MILKITIKDNTELDIEDRVTYREDTTGHPIIQYKNLQHHLQYMRGNMNNKEDTPYKGYTPWW
jgi:hypothetical protein